MGENFERFIRLEFAKKLGEKYGRVMDDCNVA